MNTSISIFGLGYIGTVSAACFARQGHRVVGVDVNPQKVEIINSGHSTVVEEDIDEMVGEMVKIGRLRATTDVDDAIMNSDVSMICVGTPSNHNGSLDLTYVRRVVTEIGAALAKKDAFHIVILRSTVLPGTTETVVIPELERTSGKTAGRDFGICFNPEFLREGTSVRDFFQPPFTVIGAYDPQTVEAASGLYQPLNAPLFTVPIKSAEMIKYANNAFHALKVTFANEIGNICKAQGIDSREVMDIFCMDTKLNLSSYYLKPGFAFGGSCLPKDLRALLYHGHRLDLNLPVLEAILPSNDGQIRRGFELIQKTGRNKVGILGFSFKAGTDDLRESPLVILIETLIGKGYDVMIYDRNVSLARLHGSNRDYIERVIPHVAALMCDSVEEVVANSEVIVIGNGSPEFQTAIQKTRPDQIVVDLVCISQNGMELAAQYDGICW
ncbi:MAG: GDP-mannose dehydrogenase [Chloroflexi bacterium]|nr:GDP-mannose dehydrogenase [Chloroflexota bacterium]MDL1943050.1 UDP-glucose/GDP-mannose dehydrogenase family protein [Chloroflexi bacterium CFX2]